MTRERMNMELHDIWRQTDTTVIFVTHLLEQARAVCDRALLLVSGGASACSPSCPENCQKRSTAMYGSWHDIVPVIEPEAGAEHRVFDIVGPVCETGDFLGKDRELALAEGERFTDVFDAVLDAWQAYPAVDFPNYPAGSWGPEESQRLFEKEAHKWRHSLDPEPN